MIKDTLAIFYISKKLMKGHDALDPETFKSLDTTYGLKLFGAIHEKQKFPRQLAREIVKFLTEKETRPAKDISEQDRKPKAWWEHFNPPWVSDPIGLLIKIRTKIKNKVKKRK